MKTVKTIVFLTMTIFQGTFQVFAKKNESGVIVKYKQYESFDLGNLEVKGEIIAPGDVSVQERNRKKFYRNLHLRKSFDREMKSDIDNLR